MSSVEEQVKNIVSEQLGVEKEKITRESNFVNDLGLSLIHISEPTRPY